MRACPSTPLESRTCHTHAARDESDARGLDRNVRAGADGETHLGRRNGRGVVDAVAGHADDVSFPLPTAGLLPVGDQRLSGPPAATVRPGHTAATAPADSVPPIQLALVP